MPLSDGYPRDRAVASCVQGSPLSGQAAIATKSPCLNCAGPCLAQLRSLEQGIARGKVLLVKLRGYSCINSLRELSSMKAGSEIQGCRLRCDRRRMRRSSGTRRVRANLKNPVSDLKVPYPVLIDSDRTDGGRSPTNTGLRTTSSTRTDETVITTSLRATMPKSELRDPGPSERQWSHRFGCDPVRISGGRGRSATG